MQPLFSSILHWFHLLSYDCIYLHTHTKAENSLGKGVGSGKKQREKHGFHDREEDITSGSWHDKEAIRAIKDEEKDWLLRG